MSRKYIFIIEALIAGLLLSACSKNALNNNSDKNTPNAEPMDIKATTPVPEVNPEMDYKAKGEDGAGLLLSADGSGNDINSDGNEENESVMHQDVAQMFVIENITQEIKDRINGKSYGEDCTVPYEDLRYVKVLHWGFDGQPHEGELIVNKAIAEDIVEIFKELYEHKYPIEKMVLVDEYDADDNASMTDNNTSAFNFRPVPDGSGRLSNHSYGLAIDINPLYNPYVTTIDGKKVVLPENGSEYADRSLDCPYYIRKDDICYKAFTGRGFTWGGDWKNTKDYQHFQKKID